MSTYGGEKEGLHRQNKIPLSIRRIEASVTVIDVDMSNEGREEQIERREREPQHENYSKLEFDE